MSNRKSFVFSAEAMQRLEQLRRACRMTSSSNVIRLALMVLEDLLGALSEGKTIVFVGPDGSRHSYHPLVETSDKTTLMRQEPASAG